jgi:LasA protease
MRFIRRMAVAMLAAGSALAIGLAGPSAAGAPDTTSRAALEKAVTALALGRLGTTEQGLHAAGREIGFTPLKESPGWVFGYVVATAPTGADAYPQAWLYLAQRTGGAWRFALEGTAEFAALTGAAPFLDGTEKRIYASTYQGGVSTQATIQASANPVLRLPFALNVSWTFSGGLHSWDGVNGPHSSIDLAGGNGQVLAAGAGAASAPCSKGPKGWVRIYHDNGYRTDYYHMTGNVNPGGARVGEGAFLGNIGTDVTCGGSAARPHVHFSIGLNNTFVGWHQRAAGKWVFWDGASQYSGYALHGSTRVDPGGALFNYGALASNQGIVDTNGGGVINKRSGPGTGFPIVGTAADGATVTISCWRNGTTHTGRYGTTSVWDRLTDGSWVSDAFLYTGTSTIGPNC